MRTFLKGAANFLLNLVFVPKCAGCGERMEPESQSCFCEKCLYLYETAKERECPKCGKALVKCTCPTPKLERNRVRILTKLINYHPHANDLSINKAIFKLKKTADRRLVSLFAHDMAETLLPIVERDRNKFVVTYAPRTKKAISKYGYDHMEYVSREVAKILEIPWAKLIVRHAGKEQKSLSYAERVRNVNISFNEKNKVDIKGKSAILIDDIVTTSATLSTCAVLLRKNGIKTVIASVISISSGVYNDLWIKKK